ncbi:hypothetical protein M1P56_16795 [Streptomyces sp. HU2014]|uniref:hypothetical protein n=1 Tax=Streptomyces sp. HU2014 TaxID=2939414 RepID=UPI00200CFCB9|nr:hypothetical protein [Streptomyces sp. HU2014]UQI45898.1 hypothetical protein M1P56_16795 [Streptomyces sp. HU2014]
MKKIVPVSLLCAALALGAVGCDLSDGYAEPKELLGSWRGGQGAELTFREDGSLTAVKVPTSFADSPSNDNVKPLTWFTGKGTWRLEKKTELGNQRIDVILGEVFGSKESIALKIDGKGAKKGIFIRPSEDGSYTFAFKRSSPHG